VRLLDRYMPRQLAVLVTILGAVGILVIAGMIVIPPVASEVTEFVEDLPGILTDAEERLRAEALRLEEEGLLPADTDQLIGDLEAELGDRVSDSIEPFITGV